MDRVLTSKLVQARKHYPCDACYWWDRSGYGLDDCETSEQRLMVEAAQADKWRILPGQMYLKETGVISEKQAPDEAPPADDFVREMDEAAKEAA